MSNLHGRHRARMRERFVRNGMFGFSKHEIIEVLLYPVIHMSNTNEIAHRLIIELGGVSEILEAPLDRLTAVKGVGYITAVYLRFIGELVRYYLQACAVSGTPITSIDDAALMLQAFARGRREETVLVMSMDAKNKLLGIEEIMSGTSTGATLYPSDVIYAAKRGGASSILLAHNHLSGDATPTPEDIAASVKARDALAAEGIKLLDHLVLADDDFVSMSESGYI